MIDKLDRTPVQTVPLTKWPRIKTSVYKFFRKLALKTVVRWEFLFLVVGFLLGRAVILSNLTPFALPYFATVFVLKPEKKGLALVSLLAGALTTSITQGVFLLIAMLSFIIVRAVMVHLFFKGKVRQLPLMVFISAVVSRIAFTFFMKGTMTTSQYFLAGVEAALAFILTLIFIQSIPLLVTKMRKRTLKNEEMICFIILLASVLTGTIGWDIHSVSMENVFSRYFVLLFAFVGGAAIGSTVGVVIGLILSLANVTSLYQMSLLAFSGLLGGLLKEGKKPGVSLGLIIGTLLIGLYGGGYNHIIQTTIDSCISILFFILTPKRLTSQLAAYIPGTKEYHQQQQQYLRKIRDVTAGQVEQFSNLFQALSNSFSTHQPWSEDQETSREVDQFLSKVTENTCQTCFKKEFCWVKNFDKTYDHMTAIMNEVKDDPVIKSPILKREWRHHCVKSQKVVDVIFEQLSFYEHEQKLKQKVMDSRRLVADQLLGVSQVMGDFAKEIQRERETHQQQEELILIKLQELGLDIENVEIYSLEEGAVDIEMTLPYMDHLGESEKVIAPILSDILKETIIVKRETQSPVVNGDRYISFGSAKAFIIETGVANTAKGGAWVSGDNYSTFELGTGKYAIAISDGMGNGERAYLESDETLKLLTKVLKSGIDETIAIKSINSILSLRSTDEIFSTLDLAMIDLQNAAVKFLKIGSNPSFVKRGEQIIKIEASNLPMGIIQDFDVDVVTDQLKSEDILIMMSDGIFDSPKHIENKEVWIKRKIKEMKTNDPQEIADLLLEEVIRASDGFINDDMTVIVSKVKRHIPKWAAIPTYSGDLLHTKKAQ